MKPKWLAPRCELDTCPNRKRLWPGFSGEASGILFQGSRLCGPECFERAVTEAITRLWPQRADRKTKNHRVPLGLLMLSQGVISDRKLKAALQAQRESGSGRLGEWLRRLGGLSEQQVTAALGVQWSCPVFPLHSSRTYLDCGRLVPLPILEASAMVPVHYLAPSGLLYLAFGGGIDHTALYAVERMLECRTQPCLADQSSVERALDELRLQPRPTEIVFDSLRDPREMARASRNYAVSLEAHEARLVACAEYFWMRVVGPRQASNLAFRVLSKGG